MADWRDRLLPASFNGVPFKVAGAEVQGSRRIITHVFPLADFFTHLDLGANPDLIRVEAYVLGDDYLEARDALEDALRKPGAGVLILPRRGPARVLALRYVNREDTNEAGISYFAMTFERVAAVPANPGKSPSTRKAEVEKVSGLVEKAAAEEFAAVVAQSGVSSLTEETVRTEVASLSESIGSAIAIGPGDFAADLLRRLKALADGPLGLLEDVVDFAVEVQDVIRRFSNAATSRLAAFGAYIQLLKHSVGSPRGQSAQSKKAQEGAQMVGLLGRTSALIGAAKAAADVDWASRAAALAAQQLLMDAIADISIAAPDSVYAQMQALRVAVAAALPGNGRDLPSLEIVSVLETEPALVIAHRLYGSVDQEQAIIGRNGIAHPGFVPGGTQLEVVASGA